MRTIAVLPIKSFSAAKQRLAEELDAPSRRALAEAMFADVLVALRRTRGVERTLVVTGDYQAQQIAGGYGASVIGDEDDGHNAAAARGVSTAMREGAQRALLVPGDCPLLDPRELDELIARPLAGASALILSDRHGTGTNGLLLTPPDCLQPSFGPGSAERHAAHAHQSAVAAEVVLMPSLALDIDTPEDLGALHEQLEATHGGAAHTRGMLRQLMRTTR